MNTPEKLVGLHSIKQELLSYKYFYFCPLLKAAFYEFSVASCNCKLPMDYYLFNLLPRTTMPGLNETCVVGLTQIPGICLVFCLLKMEDRCYYIGKNCSCPYLQWLWCLVHHQFLELELIQFPHKSSHRTFNPNTDFYFMILSLVVECAMATPSKFELATILYKI